MTSIIICRRSPAPCAGVTGTARCRPFSPSVRATPSRSTPSPASPRTFPTPPAASPSFPGIARFSMRAMSGPGRIFSPDRSQSKAPGPATCSRSASTRSSCARTGAGTCRSRCGARCPRTSRSCGGCTCRSTGRTTWRGCHGARTWRSNRSSATSAWPRRCTGGGCRRRSRASSAATWTTRSWAPARPRTFRSSSTERCSRPATATPFRATARSA